jgi:DNA-binding MarR family transcriptional regulator
MSRKKMTQALSQALSKASGHSLLYSQAVAARLGINSTDLECLDFLGRRGPMTAGAMAEAAGLTTGAVTGIVDRLESAGLACRKPDASDRRKVVVHALPQAEARITPLFKPMEAAILDALAPFDEPALQILLEFMTKATEASSAALTRLIETVPLPTPSEPPIKRPRIRGSGGAVT